MRQPVWQTPSPLDPDPKWPPGCSMALRQVGARDKRIQGTNDKDSTPSAPPAMVVSVPGSARQSSTPISAAGQVTANRARTSRAVS